MKRAAALFGSLTIAFAIATPTGATAAEFGIVPGSLAVRMLDAEGHPENRAGSHPDRFQIDFALDAEETSARDFEFELPPGFSGNPAAVPQCPRELVDNGEECPEESRVGSFRLELSGGGEFTLPLFQLEPKPGELFSMGSLPGFEVPLEMEVRPTDFGFTFRATDLPETAVSGGHMELWGVPADRQSGTSIPRRPFLTAPTGCGSVTVAFRTRSWQPEAPWLSAGAETEAPLDGCENLTFEPQLALQLSDPVADSPTGAQIDVNLSENSDPDGLASAQVRAADIALPDGLTVSPGGAAGLTACSDAQLGLGKSTEASCPQSSRIGTVEVASPELPGGLQGAIYLGEERPGERFRMFVVAPGSGIVVKFVSVLHSDPGNGRLSAVLTDLPQVPLTRLGLRFDGGQRALLATPLTCGSFVAAARLEPYGGGPPVESSVPVQIGPGGTASQCSAAAPFSPGLVIASTRRAAGRPTAFSMSLVRQSGEQLTRRFAVTLPGSLGAGLGGIASCPGPAAATGACPAESRVGTASASVGSGSSLAALHGDVYVAGPYRRAPFSLVMAFRAAIGPFDLGTATVRAGADIQRRSGQVTVVSDPLPQLVEGVPIRFRTVGMALDRAGLMRNPTSCKPAGVSATFESNQGLPASATSSLTVSGCRRLAFNPRFSMVLAGRSELREDGKPWVRVAARLGQNDARLGALHLSFPRAMRFDISGLREVCPRLDARDGLCSAAARVGAAYARSSLLAKPLKGSLYVVQPTGDGLPDLWFSVSAMGVHMDLVGKTSVRHGRVVADLTGLPDLPLSAFSMRLRGGEHGMLSLGASPCDGDGANRLASRLVADGQNGARRTLRLKAKAHCGPLR